MKQLSFLFIMLCATIAFSQTPKWVSTQSLNKKVVLEEFTGIHCGYCPDGHKVANDMVSANPDNVILMNIHAGSFAVPAAGEPDFRTTDGTLIDASSGVTGYPAGNVNRATTPWSMSRGSWTTAASTVGSQSSPVNVFVTSTIDDATRELITEVEVYYSGAGVGSANLLTVALLQNNILGPQTDYGNYNPTNWVGDKYKHNHVFRKILSPNGAFGESLDTLTAGKYYYRKYVTTLPGSITNVPLNIYNLEVVAFVSKSDKSNIFSGAKAEVTYDASKVTDLGMTDLTVYPTTKCFTTINPKIEVTNNLDKVVTAFTASVNIGGVAVSKTYTGSLAKGAKTTFDFGDIAYTPKGSFNVKFTGFTNINGTNVADINLDNDNIVKSSYGFKKKAFSEMSTGFENPSIDSNVVVDYSVKAPVLYSNTSIDSGGAEGTKKSLLVYLHSSWNVAGSPTSVILGEADFSTSDGQLTYYYAYSDGGQGGSKPTIDILTSKDCGATWKNEKTMLAVQTGAPKNTANLYKPATSEFKMETVDLKNISGTTGLIKLSVTPGSSGNAFYFDQIKVKKYSYPTSINTTSEISVSIFPNPATEVINVELGATSTDATIQIIDVKGSVVMTGATVSNTASLNVSTLANGVYTVKVSNGSLNYSEKLMINN